jgi:hypothetical protein
MLILREPPGSSADSASTRHIVKHDVYAMQHEPKFSKVGHASLRVSQILAALIHKLLELRLFI